MSAPDRDVLLREVAKAEARLAEMVTERTAVTRRLEALRAELSTFPSAALGSALPVTPAAGAPQSSKEKVRLFRTLFRGRTDVFPKHWQNPKTNKKGYSPACSNEWVRGVCEKPRVKCGDCLNQAFLAVTDRMILDHLQGRYIVGVYPLLEDETCWFLALDFDKGNWKDDVTAFVGTCRKFELTVAVERSRSGNGAHVWLFFSKPVSASVARKLGCYLLTETMADRHELSMSSYDRLFPNQDTMPGGGFGNLIALPFQHIARQDGNTLFVDDKWAPYTDQWAYLAGLPRLEPARVEDLAAEATDKRQVIGVRMGESADQEDGAFIAGCEDWFNLDGEDRSKFNVLVGRFAETLGEAART